MAATLSLSLSIDPQTHHRFPFPKHHTRPFSHPHLNFQIYPSHSFKISSSTPSHSHSHSSTTSPPPPPQPPVSSLYLDDPFRTGRFLTNDELDRLRFLESFVYSENLKSGSMWVRVMRPDETDTTVALLADSFAESMMLPAGYAGLLRFLIKKYLLERRTLMPHMATLLGFYRENATTNQEEQEVKFAGTVEVCFDQRGANTSIPSPLPPRNSPYICNMAVHKSLRRRGIGWHLLNASEELISKMSSSREVYLHCRMIDEAPFSMYEKANYKVVKTDSILVLLMLQRRKHLMCKKLPLSNTPSETDLSGSDE
ncbi:hypothetical protein PIB30_042123 [Stylosanthes scabra]|uniref:N-acetyltransferase domain-containing protein n=1 Tax=Stylosanthes scabra TaxID=79078 RepID=A0ABU6WDH6_9FABA|nr:hypothetical protein [Stylosanthes scabra]